MWCTTTIYKIYFLITKFLDKGTHSHYKIIPAKTCPSRKKTFLKENVKQMLTLYTKKYF